LRQRVMRSELHIVRESFSAIRESRKEDENILFSAFFIPIFWRGAQRARWLNREKREKYEK